MPAEHHIEAAWAAYRRDRPLVGIGHARQAVEADGTDGESWYALACNLERAGRLREADRAFAAAARAPANPVAAPFRVTWSRFQRAVADAAAALPPDMRAALDEVTLVLGDYAEPYLLEGHADPELLGMFEGAERAEREGLHGMVSPRIHLWRRSHEHAAGSARDFAAEVRQTLHHELGHYLGYDEDSLEGLGLG